MTLTLEVKPETEARLRDLAARRGVDVATVVEELASDADKREQAEAKAERRAILRRLRGRLKGSGPTVDDFLRERREEARREVGL